jgi:hypothetical protein
MTTLHRLILGLVLLLAPGIALAAQAGGGEAQVVRDAAAAMGGLQRLQAVKSLRIIGYGQMAYQDGAGNISSSPRAPQKWVNVNAHRRVIDYEHGRMNLQQTQLPDFVMAAERLMTGRNRFNLSIDNGVAWATTAAGPRRASAAVARVRRIEMVNNPLGLIRAAADPRARLSRLRTEDGELVMDVRTPDGDALVLAVNATTKLPSWMRWTAPHPNFGDVAYTTYWTGYQVADGWLKLPSGYNTVSDFRGVVAARLYVDKYELDTAIPDLSAPADVKAAPVPPNSPTVKTEVVPVAKGIWYIKGEGNSTLWEFKDHLVLYEAYGSEANMLAIIAAARATVPGKPITQLIMSHHHLDHTGGLRAAASEGLTIIANAENVAYVKEVTGRRAANFPDALERSGRGAAKVIPVTDQLVLKDETNEIDIYKSINNNHYANGVIAWSPAIKAVSQGDMVDEGWDLVWNGNSYMDTVAYWKLPIELDLAVHGNINKFPDVVVILKRISNNAKALCARADAAVLNVQGCPITMTLDQY